MKKVCLINGSFRGDKASSLVFLEDFSARMKSSDFSVRRIGMKAGRAPVFPEEDFEAMARADALVLAFPLFVYCLSGGLLRFLEDFRAYLRKGGERKERTRLYSIVNCGFPDPRVAAEALRVVRNFCSRTALEYRFSVSIGCGPAVVATRKVPLLNRGLNRALAGIARDLLDGEVAQGVDLLVSPAIPKAVLIKIKDI